MASGPVLPIAAIPRSGMLPLDYANPKRRAFYFPESGGGNLQSDARAWAQAVMGVLDRVEGGSNVLAVTRGRLRRDAKASI